MIITRDALATNVTHHRTTKTDHFVATIFSNELRLTIVTVSKIRFDNQLDVILNNYPVIRQIPVFICPPTINQHQHFSQELYNPVYEELSNGENI